MKLSLKTQSKSNQEHALLSPSGAKKWLNCAASLACEADIPNESGAAAVAGTAMHTIAEHQLNRYKQGTMAKLAAREGCYVTKEGKGAIVAQKPESGGVLITSDMIGQVQKYVDYCTPIHDAAELFEIEQRVNLTRVLHPGRTVKTGPAPDADAEDLQTFGTADLVAVVRLTDGSYMLIVGDLKTGRHKVLAKENKQMMLYALGLLRVYKRLYDITAVRLVIFQPYAGGADEWDTTPEAQETFGKYASERAIKAIDAFERGKKGLKPADFNPSNDACQWCRFAEKCNAKRKVASDAVSDGDLADEALKSAQSGEMTPEQLKAEYDKLPLMRQHIADIEKAVYTALMRGDKVAGLKLVEGKPGNRSWKPDTDDVQICKILEMSGMSDEAIKDTVYETSMRSVASMEKAAPKTAWEELKGLVTRKPGQPSIATADDKRAEWKPNTVSDTDLAD